MIGNGPGTFVTTGTERMARSRAGRMPLADQLRNGLHRCLLTVAAIGHSLLCLDVEPTSSRCSAAPPLGRSFRQQARGKRFRASIELNARLHLHGLYTMPGFIA